MNGFEACIIIIGRECLEKNSSIINCVMIVLNIYKLIKSLNMALYKRSGYFAVNLEDILHSYFSTITKKIMEKIQLALVIA